MIKWIEQLDPGALKDRKHKEIQVLPNTDDEIDGLGVLMLWQEDYFESGGIAYSGITLTKEDLIELLKWFDRPKDNTDAK